MNRTLFSWNSSTVVTLGACRGGVRFGLLHDKRGKQMAPKGKGASLGERDEFCPWEGRGRDSRERESEGGRSE